MLERSRLNFDDNIKLDLEEMGWGWSGLIWLAIGAGGELL
jgi:hypothetical protein